MELENKAQKKRIQFYFICISVRKGEKKSNFPAKIQ